MSKSRATTKKASEMEKRRTREFLTCVLIQGWRSTSLLCWPSETALWKAFLELHTFVCLFCTQQLHQAEVKALQAEPATLKAKLTSLRDSVATATAAAKAASAPSGNNATSIQVPVYAPTIL